jgi:hypothetical protein
MLPLLCSSALALPIATSVCHPATPVQTVQAPYCNDARLMACVAISKRWDSYRSRELTFKFKYSTSHQIETDATVIMGQQREQFTLAPTGLDPLDYSGTAKLLYVRSADLEMDDYGNAPPYRVQIGECRYDANVLLPTDPKDRTSPLYPPVPFKNGKKGKITSRVSYEIEGDRLLADFSVKYAAAIYEKGMKGFESLNAEIIIPNTAAFTIPMKCDYDNALGRATCEGQITGKSLSRQVLGTTYLVKFGAGPNGRVIRQKRFTFPRKVVRNSCENNSINSGTCVQSVEECGKGVIGGFGYRIDKEKSCTGGKYCCMQLAVYDGPNPFAD